MYANTDWFSCPSCIFPFPIHIHLYVAEISNISMVTPMKGTLLSLCSVIDSLGTRGELCVSATTALSLPLLRSSHIGLTFITVSGFDLLFLTYTVYFVWKSVTDFHWLQEGTCHHTAGKIRSLLRCFRSSSSWRLRIGRLSCCKLFCISCFCVFYFLNDWAIAKHLPKKIRICTPLRV